MSLAELGLRVVQTEVQHQLWAISHVSICCQKSPLGSLCLNICYCAWKAPSKGLGLSTGEGRKGTHCTGTQNRTQYLGSTNWLRTLSSSTFYFNSHWLRLYTCSLGSAESRVWTVQKLKLEQGNSCPWHEQLPQQLAENIIIHGNLAGGSRLHSFWGNILYCPIKQETRENTFCMCCKMIKKRFK